MKESLAAPLNMAVFFILFALADGEKHGYAIMREVKRHSENGFRLGPAKLYTTIQKLLEQSLIEESEGDRDADSRRRYYGLTSQGRQTLEAELARMESLIRSAKTMKLRQVTR